MTESRVMPEGIHVRVNVDMLERIDSSRGNRSRAEFIRMCVDIAFGVQANKSGTSKGCDMCGVAECPLCGALSRV